VFSFSGQLSTDLDGLLLHADTCLNTSWSKGGLYYAPCDTGWDKDGNYTYVEPYTENAAVGYARLNMKDGQKKMVGSAMDQRGGGEQTLDRWSRAWTGC
jgi:hypothetical protein